MWTLLHAIKNQDVKYNFVGTTTSFVTEYSERLYEKHIFCHLSRKRKQLFYYIFYFVSSSLIFPM